MRIDILTLFPAMFRGPFDESIVKRAIDAGAVSIQVHDIRDWAGGRHKVFPVADSKAGKPWPARRALPQTRRYCA